MCCRIFVYSSCVGETLYLNGPDCADVDRLLALYIDWYNTDYIVAPDGSLDGTPKSVSEYTYKYNFCPLDFYDDYKKMMSKALKE